MPSGELGQAPCLVRASEYSSTSRSVVGCVQNKVKDVEVRNDAWGLITGAWISDYERCNYNGTSFQVTNSILHYSKTLS